MASKASEHITGATSYLPEQLPEQQGDFGLNFPKDVNVLILGGTGHGKSFFINMFDKLALYKSLADAEQPDEFILPIVFNHNGKLIREGFNENAAASQAESETQKPKIYEYPTKYGTLRLIDTPGMGDTRGFKMDITHVEQIISCICKFDKIHAVLLFFKSTDNRLDARAKYQMCELLSCLGRKAINNVQFIITHAGIRAEPGDASTVIESFIRQLAVAIPFTDENTFCFENDPLKYLVLRKQGKSLYNSRNVELFKLTYENNVAEYIRLFASIFLCSQPYVVSEYKALAAARQIWPRLTLALVEQEFIQKYIEVATWNIDAETFDRFLKAIAEIEARFPRARVGVLREILAEERMNKWVMTGALAGGMTAYALAGAVLSPLGVVVGYLTTAFIKKKLRRTTEADREREEAGKRHSEEHRVMYRKFTAERDELKKLDNQFAACLRENSLLTLTSAKELILNEEIIGNAHDISVEEREQLEHQLDLIKEQADAFKLIPVDGQVGSAPTPGQLLETVERMTTFEYYGPPLKTALDIQAALDTTTFRTVKRSKQGKGYIFDEIFVKCFEMNQN